MSKNTQTVDWQQELNTAVYLYLQALQAATGKKPNGADAYDNLRTAESTLAYAWGQFVRYSGISTPASPAIQR